jgi:hypothetical protein
MPLNAASPALVLAPLFKNSRRLISDSFNMKAKAPFNFWEDYTLLPLGCPRDLIAREIPSRRSRNHATPAKAEKEKQTDKPRVR